MKKHLQLYYRAIYANNAIFFHWQFLSIPRGTHYGHRLLSKM